MQRYLNDIMKIRKPLGRKESVLVSIESAILYYLSIIKKLFVKVAKGNAISCVWLAGDGMKICCERRCLYEVTRCA